MIEHTNAEGLKITISLFVKLKSKDNETQVNCENSRSQIERAGNLIYSSVKYFEEAQRCGAFYICSNGLS